jgi:hypothetical protein
MSGRGRGKKVRDDRSTKKKSIRLRRVHLYALVLISGCTTLFLFPFSPWSIFASGHVDAPKPTVWFGDSNDFKREDMIQQANGRPISVFGWSNPRETTKTAVRKHLMENGIAESPHLTLVKKEEMLNMNIMSQFAWVADASVVRNWTQWCDDLLQDLSELRQQYYTQKHSTNISWPVYIVDYKDSARILTCPEVESFMASPNFVQYSTRSIAKNRQWLSEQTWVHVGNKMGLTTRDNSGKTTTFLHTPMMVRTDTVQTMQSVLHFQHSLTLADPIETVVNRSLDVVHFWPLDGKSGVGEKQSKLRTRVSEIVQDMGQRHNLNTFVGLQGKTSRTGRQTVATSYVETLLASKIVVVTQRDGWEDHYRLFEALISGACVLSDFMYGLPAGLINGTSVVLYSSAPELQSQLLYYLEHVNERLAIAGEGRRVAMTRHRTWHRMEEIIFGRVLSTCSNRSKTYKKNSIFVDRAIGCSVS